jgi:hypothetical protein
MSTEQYTRNSYDMNRLIYGFLPAVDVVNYDTDNLHRIISTGRHNFTLPQSHPLFKILFSYRKGGFQ